MSRSNEDIAKRWREYGFGQWVLLAAIGLTLAYWLNKAFPAIPFVVFLAADVILFLMLERLGPIFD